MVLRGVQLFCTLLLTALIGNVIATNVNAAGSATAAVNFTMFVAVICWITSIYGLASSFANSLSNPKVLLPLDGIATLFTFIDAIVLAAMIKAVNCADLDPSLGESYIGFGSLDNTKRCREIQASTAFMWFLFLSSAGSLFFTVKDTRSGGAKSYASSSYVSSAPPMSHV